MSSVLAPLPAPPSHYREPLLVGGVVLASRFTLAPLAGYTNYPFRRSVREIGGVGLCTTDLVNARAVLEKSKKTLELLVTGADDRPLSVQIFGGNAAELAGAAKWLEGYGADFIDINMGCPVRKVVRVGGGSAMMCDTTGATVKLVEQVVQAVSIPVTVKMRLGWDDDNLTAPHFAREFERIGVAAVTIHGRTREQGFHGVINPAGIRAVVEAVERIPVIGNGDVTSPEAALRMLRETGCRGIMVARGALRDPWLVRDIWQALRGLPPLPVPSRADRILLLLDQFERSILHYDEKHAVAIFRRWIPELSKKLELGKETMLRLLRIAEIEEMRRTLAELAGMG